MTFDILSFEISWELDNKSVICLKTYIIDVGEIFIELLECLFCILNIIFIKSMTVEKEKKNMVQCIGIYACANLFVHLRK